MNEDGHCSNQLIAWFELQDLANADDNDTSTKLPLHDTARDGGPWRGPSVKEWLRHFAVPGSDLHFNITEDDRIEALMAGRYPDLLKGVTDVRSQHVSLEGSSGTGSSTAPPRAGGRGRGLEADHGRGPGPERP
jgi:hypothetical protein